MCENTRFFPLLSRYFRACEIDPLMHNEFLVCTCFQALVVWRFYMCTCLYPKHSFQHKHFGWLKVNSYKSKWGPEKSLKSPRTFRLKKCMNPPCHVLYMHTVLLLTICTIVNRGNIWEFQFWFFFTIQWKSVHLWRDILNPYFPSVGNIQTVTSSIVQY